MTLKGSRPRTRRKETDDGKLFCTRGKHYAELSAFKRHVSGRWMPWCSDCLRAYNRTAAAVKREERKRLAKEAAQC